MLRSLKELENFTVGATDGDIGTVGDFYFDDGRWAVRYLVVQTGGFWEHPTPVLITPLAFRQVDWPTQRFHLALTQQKVKDSPSIDLDKPVSRQFEQDYYRYYGWPYYWGSDGLWGNMAYPAELVEAEARGPREDLDEADPNLRSLKEVTGYHLQGVDGEIGHVADLIVDDRTWAIRYLVVDTSNWWMGKQILLSPHWVERISWAENNVYLTLPREAIKNSPEWKPDQLVNREYEVRLYDYYGRPAYWADAAKDDDDSRVAGAPPKVL